MVVCDFGIFPVGDHIPIVQAEKTPARRSVVQEAVTMGAFVIFVVGVSLYVAVRVVEGFFGRW